MVAIQFGDGDDNHSGNSGGSDDDDDDGGGHSRQKARAMTSKRMGVKRGAML